MSTPDEAYESEGYRLVCEDEDCPLNDSERVYGYLEAVDKRQEHNEHSHAGHYAYKVDNGN